MDESDKELTRLALMMYACWIETGDPMLSRNDAVKQKRHKEINQLDEFQEARVQKLRKLAGEVK